MLNKFEHILSVDFESKICLMFLMNSLYIFPFFFTIVNLLGSK